MTVKRVAIVWRNAIIAVARRRGLAALDARTLAWLDDLGVDSAELWSNKKATRKTCLRPHSNDLTRSYEAERKRRLRADPVYLERERERDRERRGSVPLDVYRSQRRAQAEARAADPVVIEARLARQRELNRAHRADPEVRADDARRARERRAAMSLEERREEWCRHQRAKRERDRAAREALASYAEAAE